MIFDKTTLFSDAQAVTASAASTHVVDLGATDRVLGASANLRRDIGRGTPVPLSVQVVEDFAGLTSLTVAIQTSDDAAFGSGVTTHASSGAVPVAELKAGWTSTLHYMPPAGPEGMKRYLRLNYTVAGSNASSGKITAGVTFGHQTNDGR
ncbi:hypothetical protein GCM10007276_35950 [Agaricicola taiwanensis]|uniref:Uncharacterized protein n=1 Tax=Agaricicola taiwanensis TaxID=591372 RepID=A0A8J2YNZ1_9RHOB|nr:hypothetical protein [Agaricicola taiwanensis]GGE55686.1 hypothetical protein GCM10007276_35950 [Agaricicola taiwanensis]